MNTLLHVFISLSLGPPKKVIFGLKQLRGLLRLMNSKSRTRLGIQ